MPNAKFWSYAVAISTIIAAIAGVLALKPIFFSDATLPQQPITSINISNNKFSSSFEIVDADFELNIHYHYLLWLSFKRNFFMFDVVVRNSENTKKENCRAEATYEGSYITGGSGLHLNFWKYISEDRADLFFDIEPNAAFRGQFFTEMGSESPKIERSRIRIVCQKPTLQITPLHQVNMSNTRWPKN